MGEKPDYLKFGKRHILVIWLFTGFMNVYILRVCINTAIVSMVFEEKVNTTVANVTNSADVCLPPAPDNSTLNSTTKVLGEFHWDTVTQGLIKSSFYYGYMGTQFLGGYLPQLFGGRLVYGVGIVGCAILTLLNPVAARFGDPSLLIAIRVLEGCFQGAAFPCSHFLLSNWAPAQERSFLVTLPLTGANVGTVIAAPLTALLCEYGFDGGWPSAFYVWGAVALIWSIGWFYFVRDSPAVHPTISKAEREYIEANTLARSKPIPFMKIPWKSIVTSPAIWAIAIAQTCYSWNYYTMLTEISNYMKGVLHISASLNGIISSVPYICLSVVQILAAFLADIIRAKGVPTKYVRKGSHLFGMFCSSAILICIRYAGCDETLVIVMLVLAVAINGFGYAGYVSQHMDVAPQYAGLLMGFTNTWAQIPGIVSPTLTGEIIKDGATISNWQTVFYISAGISIGGAILFALLGDGEVQSWAKVTPGSDDDKKAEPAPVGDVEKTAPVSPAIQPIANQGMVNYAYQPSTQMPTMPMQAINAPPPAYGSIQPSSGAVEDGVEDF